MPHHLLLMLPIICEEIIVENLVGKVFNDLTAVRYIGGSGKAASLWEWQCVCGTIKILPAHRVKTGHDLSCGCRRSRDCDKPKDCRHCGKPSLRFNRHGNLSSVCQECYNFQCNSFKDRNPKIRMLQSARQRAKQKGLPFSITEDDFDLPDLCPVLGSKLEYGNRQRHDNSPSIDRIIPALGYVPGNIAIMSHRANWMKTNASIKEVEKLLAWMKSNIPTLEVV